MELTISGDGQNGQSASPGRTSHTFFDLPCPVPLGSAVTVNLSTFIGFLIQGGLVASVVLSTSNLDNIYHARDGESGVVI